MLYLDDSFERQAYYGNECFYDNDNQTYRKMVFPEYFQIVQLLQYQHNLNFTAESREG